MDFQASALPTSFMVLIAATAAPGSAPACLAAESPEALEVLAADQDGMAILAARRLQLRSEGLKKLRRVAEDPDATEHELQVALSGRSWIFGGRFTGEPTLRRLVEGHEYDIPLLGLDGSLRIVELKRSMSLGKGFVTRQRGALVVNAEVLHAVSQVMNYLLGLDEHRLEILKETGTDVRRASGLRSTAT